MRKILLVLTLFFQHQVRLIIQLMYLEPTTLLKLVKKIRSME